jgi:hypothetical protein
MREVCVNQYQITLATLPHFLTASFENLVGLFGPYGRQSADLVILAAVYIGCVLGYLTIKSLGIGPGISSLIPSPGSAWSEEICD